MTLEIRPITQKEAFQFVKENHRHHNVPVGALWVHGITDDEGVLVGVCVVGRPVARALDDGLTCEVTRLATDTHPNACSKLYAAARRTAIEKGFRRGLTYILSSENGSTLKACGWRKMWITKGRSWDTPSRPRTDKHPTEDKICFGWGSWPNENVKLPKGIR